jgi:hypothetical protein
MTITVSSSGHAPLQTAHHPVQSPVFGTVTSVDAPRLYLSLDADDGHRLELITANVDALRALRAGDHVRVDLDERGIALNINKTVPAPRPISYPRG